MAPRTVVEFTILGQSPPEIPASDFSAAESELGLRLPRSYREALARFGRGTFVEERWLLPPSQLQTYGSLFDKGQVKEPLPSDLRVFAASDTGDNWAWLASPSAGDGGEPSVWLIPRGCVDDENPATRPRVVATDVEVLLSSWRKAFQERGILKPYFVAAVPRMLASDIALLSPGSFRSVPEAHLALGA